MYCFFDILKTPDYLQLRNVDLIYLGVVKTNKLNENDDNIINILVAFFKKRIEVAA